MILNYKDWEGALTQRVFTEADTFATGYLWPCWLLISYHKLASTKAHPQ